MRGRRYRTNSVFSVAKHLFSCRLAGVVLYVLLCGFCPFFDECIPEHVYTNIPDITENLKNFERRSVTGIV